MFRFSDKDVFERSYPHFQTGYVLIDRVAIRVGPFVDNELVFPVFPIAAKDVRIKKSILRRFAWAMFLSIYDDKTCHIIFTASFLVCAVYY